MLIDLTKLVDWKDAPEWANFAAFDSNWDLWWFEHEPGCEIFKWSSPYKKEHSRSEKADLKKRAWTQTLMKKPVPNLEADRLIKNLVASLENMSDDLRQIFVEHNKELITNLKDELGIL